MRSWLSVIIAYGVLLIQAPVALAEGDQEKGLEFAIEHCAHCHVIGPFNKFGGIGSTPSFRSIKGMEDGLERFATFFDRRPHPAFVRIPDVEPPTIDPAYVKEFTVTAEAIEDLMAYIDTIEALDLSRIPVVRGTGPSRRQRVLGARMK